jgi:8-oxo-dGTP diphosphatase
MGREDQGVAASHSRYHVIPRVLCFVTHGERVLLLRGAAHKRIWAGKYNGLGGHVEAGEDIQAAIRREVKEESGLDPHDIRLRAVVHVDAGDPLAGILFFVFTAAADTTEVIASPEGALEWHDRNVLPANMVEDLPILLPRVLSLGPADPPLFVSYTYDEQNRLVIRWAAESQETQSAPR